MGQFKGAHITEQRIYADPSNPETSDFEVALLMTVLEAVIDLNTKKDLRAILTEQANEISAAKIAAENAKTAANEVKEKINSGTGVPASTLGGKTADEFAAKTHTHTASEITDLPTSLPANGGSADTAVKLKTARNINGISFDGSKDITVTAAANGGNADTVGGAAIMTTSALGLHRMASGTAAPTSATCSPGCWYGQYE